jgi:hypothetical protein
MTRALASMLPDPSTNGRRNFTSGADTEAIAGAGCQPPALGNFSGCFNKVTPREGSRVFRPRKPTVRPLPKRLLVTQLHRKVERAAIVGESGTVEARRPESSMPRASVRKRRWSRCAVSMPPEPTCLASSTRYWTFRRSKPLELNPESVNLARLIDEVIGTAGALAEVPSAVSILTTNDDRILISMA